MSNPTHYIWYNGAAGFVKEADYFKETGGLTQPWGLHWRPVVAESIEDARLKCLEIAAKGVDHWYDGFIFPHNLTVDPSHQAVLEQTIRLYCAFLNQMEAKHLKWTLHPNNLLKPEDFAPGVQGDPAAWSYVKSLTQTRQCDLYVIVASNGDDGGASILVATTSGAHPDLVDSVVQYFEGGIAVVAYRDEEHRLHFPTGKMS